MAALRTRGLKKMPIELNRSRRRKGVAWLNSKPPKEGERAFIEREFAIMPCSDLDLKKPDFLAGLSAVVFTQKAEKPRQVVKDLEQHAQRLLDYDCRIILLPELATSSLLINAINQHKLWTRGLPPEAAEKISQWQNSKDGAPLFPCAGYFEKKIVFEKQTFSWNTVANFVTDNPPGPAPSLSLKITPNNVADKLDPDTQLLIRRAFWDCDNIDLVPMNGGHSGACVYRAYAELEGGLHGRWPQPYFVKVGKRFQILAEYKVYEENVDPYVPFHLGPHLVRDRCCLGASKGVIVGDYVEEAESLLDCASQGRAASAIACLFDRTLLGWHRETSAEPISLATGLLRYFPRPHKFPKKRFARACTLGATLDLWRLRALFEECTSTPVLAAQIHGDLHAKNILVRATDAIVIDFYGHKKFPLVYDAACLEASLLVEGFVDDDRDIEEWLLSLDQLYNYPLMDGTLYINPKERSRWFYACVRQIRRYARQWAGQDQYAGALALALLIKAGKDDDVPEPESSRRAAAYVLAERILVKAFGSRLAANAPAQTAVAKVAS